MFDEKTLSTLATKAIIDSMTPELRADLLQRAVSGLFETEESTPPYGSSKKRTRLEATFNKALDSALFIVLRELLAQPAYQEKLREQTQVALDKYFTGGSAGAPSLSDLVFQILSEGTRKILNQ